MKKVLVEYKYPNGSWNLVHRVQNNKPLAMVFNENQAKWYIKEYTGVGNCVIRICSYNKYKLFLSYKYDGETTLPKDSVLYAYYKEKINEK